MEQFLNHITQIFQQLNFNQTTYFLNQERKDAYNDDVSVLEPLIEFLIQL